MGQTDQGLFLATPEDAETSYSTAVENQCVTLQSVGKVQTCSTLHQVIQEPRQARLLQWGLHFVHLQAEYHTVTYAAYSHAGLDSDACIKGNQVEEVWSWHVSAAT